MQFIFSTALDGKIKAWLYDNMGSRVDYDAPGQWRTTMLYSADGSRYEMNNSTENIRVNVVRFLFHFPLLLDNIGCNYYFSLF